MDVQEGDVRQRVARDRTDAEVVRADEQPDDERADAGSAPPTDGNGAGPGTPGGPGLDLACGVRDHFPDRCARRPRPTA